MDALFAFGAYLIGEITPVEDYEAKQAGTADPQLRDKETDKRVWQARVMDADPDSRKGQAEVAVKISADHQPVPPDEVPGQPFRPVEFEGLTVTPYVDTNGNRPRLAYSVRATGIRGIKGGKSNVQAS